jgi:hypothetical protein
LARHGLNVEVKRIPLGDIDVAAMLLSHAADEGVDFIVMGGYGHSRLREFFLGGLCARDAPKPNARKFHVLHSKYLDLAWHYRQHHAFCAVFRLESGDL